MNISVNVDVRQAAHRCRHGGEVESFVEHQLPQDVNDIEVLSVHGVPLKLLHVLPVLQRQTDLQPEAQEEVTIRLRSSRTLFKRVTPSRVAFLTCSEGNAV